MESALLTRFLQEDEKSHQTDRAAAKEAMAEATSLREKEKAAFDQEKSDAETNIAAIGTCDNDMDDEFSVIALFGPEETVFPDNDPTCDNDDAELEVLIEKFIQDISDNDAEQKAVKTIKKLKKKPARKSTIRSPRTHACSRPFLQFPTLLSL